MADAKAKDQEIMDWITAILKPTGVDVPKTPLPDALKDGIILCKLIAALPDGKVGKFNKKAAGKFQQLENLQAFQESMKKYGLPDEEIFAPVDLHEKRNLPQVRISLLALARKAQHKEGYTGPVIGPKEATENKREFTEEQLNEAKNIPRAW